jgi:energy-coupling factor transporter ATP-binding protein EcfA2
MRLEHFETSAQEGTDLTWRACVELGQITLLVGRNATGKSKVLASIRSLSEMVAKKKSFSEANFKVKFIDTDTVFYYELNVKNNIIENEILSINNEKMIQRGSNGVGTIKAVAEKHSQMAFQVPNHELAVVAKRDLIQHPFLESLHNWAGSLRFYPFNSFNRLSISPTPFDTRIEADPSDYRQSTNLFITGEQKLGPTFKKAIIDDMNRIGYQIEDVGIGVMHEIKFEPPIGIQPIGLYVKEKDINGPTTQLGMSDGMYRALCLIIHAAYAELASIPLCMLIDDIGEGLDFERSTELIKLLMERANRKAIQLVMSTNDRFAMNAVPLESWCGLRRTPTCVETVSQQTHPDIFKKFKLTGLNNFDFLKTDFFRMTSLNG